jgi:hypothetical protein
MNNPEIVQLFEEAFKKTVLPELKELRTELSHLNVIQTEIRKQLFFLFKQYETLETEYITIKQALERIEQKLDLLDKSSKRRK